MMGCSVPTPNPKPSCQNALATCQYLDAWNNFPVADEAHIESARGRRQKKLEVQRDEHGHGGSGCQGGQWQFSGEGQHANADGAQDQEQQSLVFSPGGESRREPGQSQ